MSSGWPQFETKQPLDDVRSWTAKFDSFDQYRDNLYYVVTLYRGDERLREFMIVIDPGAVEDGEIEIGARIARVAATGETNTEYTGSLLR